MGSVSISSYICCMFVSCVHPVAVLNVAFYMTCSLLMLLEDARGDHMEEAYSRAGLMTADVSLGGGMSAVCMLNSVCERTPPCETPVLNCRSLDVWFLYVV